MKANKILKHIEKYNKELLKIIDDTYKFRVKVNDIYNLVALDNRLLVLNEIYSISKKLEDRISKELKEGK